MKKAFIVLSTNYELLFEFVGDPTKQKPNLDELNPNDSHICIGFNSMKSANKWFDENRWKDVFKLQKALKHHNLFRY